MMMYFVFDALCCVVLMVVGLVWC